MKVEQIVSHGKGFAHDDIERVQYIDPNLVILFASISYFEQEGLPAYIKKLFPNAEVVGCSTAGEIAGEIVNDHSIVLAGIHFDKPNFITQCVKLDRMEDSFSTGQQLASKLLKDDLKLIFLLGPGVEINGSSFVQGMKQVIPDNVGITGGLAGDNGAFEQTFIIHNEHVSDHEIVAVGFYGENIQYAAGCFGGWQEFGVPRRVTKAQGNILYALDGEAALDVYKRYLGEYAAELPQAGLLFPFSILGDDWNATGIVRTILGIDEETNSLILAGEVETGQYVRLMSSSTDSLVEGARKAANGLVENLAGRVSEDSLAIIVSCVGRKLVMGGRVDEEVEAVSDVFDGKVKLLGFYSHGEVSPALPGLYEAELHNQTMTITYLSEA